MAARRHEFVPHDRTSKVGVVADAAGHIPVARAKGLCLAMVRNLEGGEFYSWTLRQILDRRHGVRAGAYSYGEGLIPGAFPAGVTIGRYVSIAPGVRVFLRNHPMDRLSLHPFFYNRHLGYIREDTISTGSLEIGHDAWLGERAIITPGCSRIGIGAVVGAGAVVTKDVPDFAIVAGNPARLIRHRFDEKTRELILASRWWELPIEQVAKHMAEMVKPLGDEPWQHPLLAGRAGSRRDETAQGATARLPLQLER